MKVRGHSASRGSRKCQDPEAVTLPVSLECSERQGSVALEEVKIREHFRLMQLVLILYLLC